MSRVIFVTWDGGGNVTPAVGIASELRKRGDEVRFLGQEQQREALEGAGFGFDAFSSPGTWTATGARGALKNAVGFLRLLCGRSLGRDLVTLTTKHPADLVVIDCLLFGVLDVAARAGLRRAVLVHSLGEAIDQKMAGGAPGFVARLGGLRPRRLWAQSHSMIAATLSELDRPGRRDRYANLTYTGPVLPPLEAASGNAPVPGVLVSLSTTYIPGQARTLQSIIDALGDLPVRGIVTTGPAVDPAELRAPANVELHRFVPHAELMPAVSLVVGHGGHATTMLALAHDLPLVVLPMNLMFDQVIIGQRIRDVGAGVTLSSKSSTAEIRDAIKNTLADASQRQAAERLGAAVRACRGTTAAADLLQTLASAEVARPVPRE
jgi:UDP:flavonoid glycosyltransferase YjiC (YdhE family)